MDISDEYDTKPNCQSTSSSISACGLNVLVVMITLLLECGVGTIWYSSVPLAAPAQRPRKERGTMRAEGLARYEILYCGIAVVAVG